MLKNIFLPILCAFFIAGCGVNTKTIKRMQLLEEGVSSPTTIEELREAIQKYGNRVEDVVQAQSQIGIWYKLLATRYLDNEMYGEALKTFQKAIEFYPENSNLYYYVGVCAGQMSKSALDYNAAGNTPVKYNYLKLSETAYLRALQIEPRYARSLYALGVLYVFELEESAKALPLLETLLTIETKHVDGMFVLARAYYITGQYEKALDMYDKLMPLAPPERKIDAENNKRFVMEAYGK